MKLYFNSNCGDATKAEIGKEIGLSDGRMKATRYSLNRSFGNSQNRRLPKLLKIFPKQEVA